MKKTMTAAMLAVAGFGAQAATYDFGPHAALELSVQAGNLQSAVGPLSDFYTFSLSSAQAVSSAVVSNNLPGILHISNGLYAVYSTGNDLIVGNGDDQLLSNWWSFDGTTGSTAHSLALGAGSYYYAVKGTVDGASGGSYTLSSTTAALVPEPETQLMMLGGLFAVAFVARRRRG